MTRLIDIVQKAPKDPQIAGQSEEKRAVLEAISAVLDRLTAAENALGFETDEDLIEAGIYEIKALNCRYSYFLKQAKRLGISKTAL